MHRIYLNVLERNSGEAYVASCTLPVQIGKLQTPDNQILLDPVYDQVSRIHGVIDAGSSGRGFVYTDRSSNGTRVGEILLHRGRTSLSPGFQIEIENYLISHVEQKPLMVLHTNSKLAEHGRLELLPGRGIGITRDAEGCRMTDLNRWIEWREPTVARIALVNDEATLIVENPVALKSAKVNKSVVKDRQRHLHSNDVVIIDQERFELLVPSEHRVVCGNTACHLINPPGFEANCKWCGHHLAATGGQTRFIGLG